MCVCLGGKVTRQVLGMDLKELEGCLGSLNNALKLGWVHFLIVHLIGSFDKPLV